VTRWIVDVEGTKERTLLELLVMPTTWPCSRVSLYYADFTLAAAALI